MVAEIMLSGPIAAGKAALVDDCVAAAVRGHSWFLSKRRRPEYPPYVVAHIGGRTTYLHRFVYRLTHGTALTRRDQIDHVDRDPLNNTLGNLRLVSQGVNNANARRRRDNRSGYKGVNFHKHTRRWRAFVQVNKKAIHLGLFDDKDAAARAVNAAYRQHYPDVALPNPSVA